MTGRLNFRIAEQYSKDAVKLAHQYNCTRFIFDHTATNLTEELVNSYVSEELQQFGLRILIDSNNSCESVYDDNSQEHVNQNSRCVY